MIMFLHDYILTGEISTVRTHALNEMLAVNAVSSLLYPGVDRIMICLPESSNNVLRGESYCSLVEK